MRAAKCLRLPPLPFEHPYPGGRAIGLGVQSTPRCPHSTCSCPSPRVDLTGELAHRSSPRLADAPDCSARLPPYASSTSLISRNGRPRALDASGGKSLEAERRHARPGRRSKLTDIAFDDEIIKALCRFRRRIDDDELVDKKKSYDATGRWPPSTSPTPAARRMMRTRRLGAGQNRRW